MTLEWLAGKPIFEADSLPVATKTTHPFLLRPVATTSSIALSTSASAGMPQLHDRISALVPAYRIASAMLAAGARLLPPKILTARILHRYAIPATPFAPVAATTP